MPGAFPPTINKGDDVHVCFALPAGTETEWIAGELTLTFLGKSGVAQVEGKVDIDGKGEMTAILLPTQTSSMDSGHWRYIARVFGGDEGQFSQTIETGYTHLNDPYSNDTDFDTEMLTILRAVYQDKATGRGDVAEYEIGDRRITSWSFKQLGDEIERIEERINLSRGRRVHSFVGGRRI